MSQFFKSKFFIILVIIAMAATVLPTTLSLMGHGGVVRDAVSVLFVPFRALAGYAADGIEGFVSYFGEFDRIREENREMRETLEDIEGRLYDADALRSENEWLKSFLSLKRENPDFTFCDAVVAGRESGNYKTILTLNCGTAHGIAVGMPVISYEGIVGMVSEVGLTSCKVTPFMQYGSSVGVALERSGDVGILENTYELQKEGLCIINYLSEGADVAVGDRVVTSGLGSVYPAGLAVGRVCEVYPDEFTRDLVAKVEPFVDIESLTRVMVVTAYDYDGVVTPSENAPTGDEMQGDEVSGGGNG